MSSTIIQNLNQADWNDAASVSLGAEFQGHIEKLRLRGDSRPPAVDSTSLSPKTSPQSSAIEDLAELLFSERHMRHIFSSPPLLSMFIAFLNNRRPQSTGVLVYYFDVLKALKAVRYANAISGALKPLKMDLFTADPPQPVVVQELEDKAEVALRYLLEEDLPAYITHIYTTAVTKAIDRNLVGSFKPPTQGQPGELVAAFFLTDCSKSDNPIVFASGSFHSLTRYRAETTFGQHLRFLYGARTKRSSICRFEEAYREVKEHCELVLNYRSDGSVYLNLLTIAPLCDSDGKVRYFLGYQIDVNSSVHGAHELQLLNKLLHNGGAAHMSTSNEYPDKRDELKDLSEMLNSSELQIVRRHGGRMHSGRRHVSDPSMGESTMYGCPSSQNLAEDSFLLDRTLPAIAKSVQGPYRDYLLLRPFPSLRILFTSPSLRVQGILQSPFLSRVGGSRRTREGLTVALATGRSVTAKIHWATHPEEEERTRWAHCTPLKGRTGRVGVWIVVLVDETKIGATEKQGRTGTVPTFNGEMLGTTKRRNVPQSSPSAGKGRWRAATPSRAPRVEEWRGTCWREDDDESEDEVMNTSHYQAGKDGVSFLTYGTDDDAGMENEGFHY